MNETVGGNNKKLAACVGGAQGRKREGRRKSHFLAFHEWKQQHKYLEQEETFYYLGACYLICFVLCKRQREDNNFENAMEIWSNCRRWESAHLIMSQGNYWRLCNAVWVTPAIGVCQCATMNHNQLSSDNENWKVIANYMKREQINFRLEFQFIHGQQKKIPNNNWSFN
jgi:hypothetical protein